VFFDPLESAMGAHAANRIRVVASAQNAQVGKLTTHNDKASRGTRDAGNAGRLSAGNVHTSFCVTFNCSSVTFVMWGSGQIYLCVALRRDVWTGRLNGADFVAYPTTRRSRRIVSPQTVAQRRRITRRARRPWPLSLSLFFFHTHIHTHLNPNASLCNFCIKDHTCVCVWACVCNCLRYATMRLFVASRR
jgi:hypothetical protein